ncbi:MAG: hypothetical protein A3D95_09985 [Betaproteobacteria bacterium RIFCSPHIGHO2_12_FULL_69_13]|nr:MAG: hypothetical protein A3D95_09985 [Betaproteobacteria bacterium RIFCSPHIGHO2_12_FULL_69_13]
MIGVNAVPPMPPRLEIENEPPCRSPGRSFLSRASLETSASSFARSNTPLRSASRITGTTSPSGVSTATPMWKYFLITRLSPDLSSEALSCGYCLSAVTHALTRNASMVSLKPRLSVSAVFALRNASSSVMSASSNCVTCGIETQLRCRFGPESFWMRESGLTSIGPNFAKSTSGHGASLKFTPPIPPFPRGGGEAGGVPAIIPFTNPSTSWCRMRPLGPLPETLARSTPSSRANFRTDGLA